MRSRLLTVLCLFLGQKSALPNLPPLATTNDLLITSEMLYQLSYTSIFLYFLVISELFNPFDQLIQE